MTTRPATLGGFRLALVLIAGVVTSVMACRSQRVAGSPVILSANRATLWLAAQYPRDSVEWDDEQAFLADNNDDFGPPARIIANPYAQQFFPSQNDIGSVTGGVLVAIIDVDPGTLSARYTSLGLEVGRNCVKLAHEGTPKRWVAYVSRADQTTKDCPIGSSGGTALPVVRSPSPTPGHDILQVARFTDDAAGNPIIGFNCVGQFWCDAGPSGTSGLTPGQKAGAPPGAGHEWKDWSRHDDEILAVTGPGGALVKGPRAAIVPAPGLNNMRIKNGSFNDYVTVATVLMQDNPAGTKYGSSWGMASGSVNEIQVKFDTISYRWEARMKVGTATRPLTIGWKPHHDGYEHHARARWRWKTTDQDAWIRCDVGCCEISGS